MSNGLTTDPNHPDLGHGGDDTPVPQNKKYLVLSDDELAKGFVRPVRDTYIHTGLHFIGQTRPLTDDEKARFVHPDDTDPFVLVEMRDEGKERFWTKGEYEQVGKGCSTATTMGQKLSETYARDPKFYGSTYCVRCSMHRPVREFRWIEADGSRGPTVGS
jgi:hypothetical protein